MACLIAAPCSGSGKTLVSLALSALVRRRGQTIQTFKVGPDYLDPQLLERVSGRPCRNLDPLLCGEAWVRRSFLGFGSQADRCLVHHRGSRLVVTGAVATPGSFGSSSRPRGGSRWTHSGAVA